LGFKLDGKGELAAANTGLKQLDVKAIAFKASLATVSAAWVKLTSSFAKTAMSMDNLALTTGLSIDALEKWQYAARPTTIALLARLCARQGFHDELV